MLEGELSESGEPLGLLIAFSTHKGLCYEPHRYILRVHTGKQLLVILLIAHDTATQVKEHFWDVNLDGAHIVAGPTE
jgi:hypothetical protein